jgi:hypothetical protein
MFTHFLVLLLLQEDLVDISSLEQGCASLQAGAPMYSQVSHSLFQSF